MHYKQMLSLIGGAMALALITAQPATARDHVAGEFVNMEAFTAPQTQPQQISPVTSDRPQPTEGRNRTNSRGGRSRNRQAPTATPAENLAAAQAQITASGKPCQVTEAVLHGRDAQGQSLYEAVCDSGPGYIIITSTPPVVVDCFELAGTAATARARNPEANVGQQCMLPANDNSLAVISGWAREAGVTCPVDQVLAVGKSASNNVIYEIGCAGEDGYWLEKTADGWSLQDCMQVLSAQGACNFTTTAEQAAGFQTKLAGTDAAACNIQELRLMGHNANGRFFEVRCAAGDGFIARVDTAGLTQQVYPCATAQQIGGGCRLTTAPAAAATPE